MSSHSESHYPHDMWVFPDAQSATQDIANKTTSMPGKFKLGLAIAGVLAIVGIVGFILRMLTDGFSGHEAWGYYGAIFSYIFIITSSAPLVAVALRLTKSHWRRPISRISELFALVGVVNVILYIPLIYLLPPINNPNFTQGMHGELQIRKTIWMEVPAGAPHLWDFLGIISLAVLSLIILWVSVVPDLAEARYATKGWRRGLYTLLAGHWYGTKKQWIHQKGSLALLGALYFLMVVFVHFLIVSDYAMSLIPGWKDSILPPLYTITGFQSSLSIILIIAFVMRKWGGYRDYFGTSVFWSASKIQIGLTLLWTYHLFAFFITLWYGRMELEQNILRYLMFESYSWLFWLNVIFIFLIPFWILVWNPVRKTAWGPALAGSFILVGNLMFQIRIFVGAFNAGDIYHLGLFKVPPPVFPDVWDIFMVVGGLGLVAFIYLLGTKVLPALSVWEVKEGAMYQQMGSLYRGEYLILAKPE